MRLDFIPQQVARAKFGAVVALVAGRLADAVHALQGPIFADHQVVAAGQDNQAGSGLGHYIIKIERKRPHHQPADKEGEFRNGCAARQV